MHADHECGRGRSRPGWVVAAALVVIAVATVACSGDEGAPTSGGAAPTPTEVAPTPPREGPGGPVPTFTPTDGGEGVSLASGAPGPSLAAAGYEEIEVVAAGTATSYASDDPFPLDGRFQVRPHLDADYATRIVVRRPTDPADFNGTVVVEWLNVSGGVDAAPEYTYTAAEIVRGGSTWVGVSAQRIGVEGGPVAVETPEGARAGAGRGLKGIDPERYGGLVHPGDAFAYDIFTQVGRAARTPAADGPFEDLAVDQVLAVGESQSAFALTTYVNGIQPLVEVYDGFLVHSRGGAAAPLGEPGGHVDIAGSLGGDPTRIRDDLDVPTIIVQTEGDVLGLLGYLPARQDDSASVRLWEVAGAAHADAFQVGGSAERLGCTTPINQGQQVFVLRAALRHLSTWAAGGDAPPEAPRLEVAGDEYVVDDVGNVRGGVRTPVVDAPVEVLSGLAPAGASIVCILFGSTTPLDAATLADLHTSTDGYRAAYEAAVDAAITAGFVLEDDRDELLADRRDVAI